MHAFFQKNNGTFSVTLKKLNIIFAGTCKNDLFDTEYYVPSAKQENFHAL